MSSRQPSVSSWIQSANSRARLGEKLGTISLRRRPISASKSMPPIGAECRAASDIRGRVLGVGVCVVAEAAVGERLAGLLVRDHDPRRVTRRRGHPDHRCPLAQERVGRRDLQHARLIEGQLQHRVLSVRHPHPHGGGPGLATLKSHFRVQCHYSNRPPRRKGAPAEARVSREPAGLRRQRAGGCATRRRDSVRPPGV